MIKDCVVFLFFCVIIDENQSSSAHNISNTTTFEHKNKQISTPRTIDQSQSQHGTPKTNIEPQILIWTRRGK